MAVYKIAIFLLLLIPGCILAQTNRYVVFLTDKANSPYTIDHPDIFLSSAALSRRQYHQIAITQEDLPVNPAYVQELKNAGARTFFSSRWMNCVLVEIGADSVGIISALPHVSKVQLVAPGHRLIGGRVRKLNMNSGNAGSAASMAQLQQLGLDEMQAEGLHGENVSVAVLDAGFPSVNTGAPFQHLYQNGQIKNTFDFVGNSANVYQYHPHGTAVLSIMAADIPGTYSGGIPAANFYLYVTEDVTSEYRIEEYNWLFAAEKADSAGVDIITTSLGYSLFDDPAMDYLYSEMDGKTTVVSRAATEAIHRGIVVVCAAGNEGSSPWYFITAPADANGVIAVGAIDLNGYRVSFSSAGPSADHRIKPDVVALGYGVSVITTAGTVSVGYGTSFAAPLIACFAAGIIQSYPHISVEKLYDAMTKSADQVYYPDNMRGYGLPNFRSIKNIIETADINRDVTIHPNPAFSDKVTVTFKKPGNEVYDVTVVDGLGRTLAQSTLSVSWENNPLQLDLRGISPGVYYVHFKSKSYSGTVKLIKV